MTYTEILHRATELICNVSGEVLDVLAIAKPPDIDYAQNLSRVISKLSPLIGNMIEYSLVSKLNSLDWKGLGRWVKQDPGFPDTIFQGEVTPQPGIEIKTWFPLATEITARFKDSVLHFEHDQINVAVVAWLPEHIIYGRPRIIDVWVGSAKSLAIARDTHYHRPPDYLIFEPEDTAERTRNLQQTCTNGYKFQGTPIQLKQAEEEVASWGEVSTTYSPSPDYQKKLRTLIAKYPYRLDTNFAKMDRIEHAELEEFKFRVLNTKISGHDIKDWSRIITAEEDKIRHLVENLAESS